MLSFFRKNERKLFFVAFIAGFIFDWLTVKYLDLKEAGIVLGLYLLVIAFSIVVQNIIKARNRKGFFSNKLDFLIPYIIQFMFGTLFNAAFIFYSESAEFYSSWPFILFILLVVFANEIFRDRHNVLMFQLSMLFIASFLYSVFALPILSGQIGGQIFILSGFISLGFLFSVMAFLARWARDRFLDRHTFFVSFIIVLFICLNVAYFANIIPPIPLAIKDSGLYHLIKKTGNDYEMLYEKSNNFWREESGIFHSYNGAFPYIFSSIFAPTKIVAPIYHKWYFFDETKNDWILMAEIDFPVVGGREGGYRGYSFYKNTKPGKWRVYITTEDGKHLGRISFKVENASLAPTLTFKKI